MPMTAAERQRLYRQRLKEQNPQKFEELRLKNLNRIKKKYVQVSKLTENQKYIRRKNWRKLKKNQKKKRDPQEKIKKSAKEYQRCYKRLKKENEKQKTIIDKQRKKIQALQKKVYRQKILLDCQISTNTSEQSHSTIQEQPLTSKTKSNNIFQTMTTFSEQDKNKVKNVMLENYVISEAIKQEYKTNKNIRKIFRNIFTSQIVRKYKMLSNLKRVIGLKSRIRNFPKCVVLKRNSKLVKKIRRFYLRDDVSRASAGKKETKTYKKHKHQKRYLLDTMSNLHKKFKEETGIKASVNTFRRHRPFYVVKPRLSDRETCVCKIHANIEYKFQALQKMKVLDPHVKLMDILEEIVCDKKSKECMYSECNICKTATATYNFTASKKNYNVTWFEWITKDVEYQKNNETKKTKKVVTESKTEKLEILLSHFEKELKKFKEHYFNIWYQYNIYRNLKNSLQNNEVIVHCDFSENYCCKLHRQIQAVHFGSQNQISLHTSVLYTQGSKPQSYCTLSDSMDHSPAAIWAHLKPVLIDIKTKHPEIDTVHVFSDGPVTQYRQKKNFYLFKLYLEELDFKRGTWNFSEAYHGKGAADGIGGLIKRLLDAKVAHGVDILNTSVAYSVLKEDTNVHLFCVNESDITEIKSRHQIAFEALVPIPDTLKIHQVQADSEIYSKEVRYRVLSCFCNSSSIRGFCDCFDTRNHALIKPRPKKRFLLSSSSDSEGYQPLVFKNRKYNATPFTVERQLTDTSISTQKSKDKITDSSTNKATIIPTVSDVIDDSDSDSLEILNISHVVDKSTLPRNKTPEINKENIDRNTEGIKNLKKKVAPVTILSNVRVNYSLDNLRQMIGTKRQNVPSYDLKNDYPEMFKQAATAPIKSRNYFDSSSESE